MEGLSSLVHEAGRILETVPVHAPWRAVLEEAKMPTAFRQRVLAIAVVTSSGLAAGPALASGPCSATAIAQFAACGHEMGDDFFTANAICINVLDKGERQDCLREARVARNEKNLLCRKQLRARRGLCGALGENRYDPDFDPGAFDTDFANLTNPNPYFPLGIGSHWEYAGGGETDRVDLLAKTKLILGVTCIVVNDHVEVGGKVREDTDDWYGQRKNGGVDYCGENSRSFETFAGDVPEEPELVEVAGSWKAGRDGALAGTAFLAAPTVGKIYRQEFSPGTAEDIAVVLSTTYGFGSDPELDQQVPQALAELLCAAHDCVVTGESTPIEPGGFQRKYYARGIGLFLDVHPASTDVSQLVGCNVDPRCATLPAVAAANGGGAGPAAKVVSGRAER